MVSNIQTRELLFDHGLLKKENNLLVTMKDPLYTFFKNAFQLSSSRDMTFGAKQNRLSDVALVWMKML